MSSYHFRRASFFVCIFLLSTFARAAGVTEPQSKAHTIASHPAEAPTPRPRSNAESKPAPAPQAMREVATPSIVVNTPTPPRAEWSTHEKIAWGAQLVFLLLGYSGLVFGYRILRRIEQHSEMAEDTAAVAVECARTLSAMRQTQYENERPWILVAVARRGQAEDEFDIQLSNRGHMVAEILKTVERVGVSDSRRQIPREANFARELPEEKTGQILLLPGEFMVLCTVRSRDLHWICKDQEQQRQIEMQELNLFFYGSVTYRGLMPYTQQPEHRTSWCGRYLQDDGRCSLAFERVGEYGFHE